MLPDGVEYSEVASLSASLFPSIPAWLGTQVKCILVPLDFRKSRRLRIARMQSLSLSGVRDIIAFMAELESTTIHASGIQPS